MVATNALRGYFDFNLEVKIASNGMHSGLAGGIVPNPILIAMHVLSRLVDFKTQEVIHPAFKVDIPDSVRVELGEAAEKMQAPNSQCPLLDGVKTMTGHP